MFTKVLAGHLLLFASAVQSATTPRLVAPALLTQRSVNREAARLAVGAIIAEATRRKLKLAVAVVDHRGALITAERLDGAAYTAIDLAAAKARSAAAGGVKTSALARAYKAGETELATLSGQIPLPGGVTLYPGGVPILFEGEVVGAVGVSGAEPAIDERLAELGAASILAALR